MANAHMPDQFFETLAHHLSPEQPVGHTGGRPRVVVRVIVRGEHRAVDDGGGLVECRDAEPQEGRLPPGLR